MVRIQLDSRTHAKPTLCRVQVPEGLVGDKRVSVGSVLESGGKTNVYLPPLDWKMAGECVGRNGQTQLNKNRAHYNHAGDGRDGEKLGVGPGSRILYFIFIFSRRMYRTTITRRYV